MGCRSIFPRVFAVGNFRNENCIFFDRLPTRRRRRLRSSCVHAVALIFKSSILEKSKALGKYYYISPAVIYFHFDYLALKLPKSQWFHSISKNVSELHLVQKYKSEVKIGETCPKTINLIRNCVLLAKKAREKRNVHLPRTLQKIRTNGQNLTPGLLRVHNSF